MKRVLIISYYWPPVGGGGVQRWLKFSKYLSKYGWQPIIFTPEKTDATTTDTSLLKEIHPDTQEIRSSIWEPYDVYKKFMGKKKDEKVDSGFIDENGAPSFTKKVALFIRGNVFIPDARRFWIGPARKQLRTYLKENKVDAIISTGPPHTTHLIAQNIQKEFSLPWIADFRDPWTQIDFYHQLRLTKWADKKHKTLEKKVLKDANRVVTVSPSWADDLKQISGRDIDLIHNGYDEADFASRGRVLDTKFTITHIGSMNADRNPFALWKVLEELVVTIPELKEHLSIQLIGQVDQSIIQSIEKHQLTKYLKKSSFIPHDHVIEKMCSSQLLLLPINNTPNLMGVLPGKLYEYMRSKRPIICIGPTDGDAAHIVRSTKSGHVFSYDDTSNLLNQIKEWFQNYLDNTLVNIPENIEAFSREALAKKYTLLLEEITTN